MTISPVTPKALLHQHPGADQRVHRVREQPADERDKVVQRVFRRAERHAVNCRRRYRARRQHADEHREPNAQRPHRALLRKFRQPLHADSVAQMAEHTQYPRRDRQRHGYAGNQACHRACRRHHRRLHQRRTRAPANCRHHRQQHRQQPLHPRGNLLHRRNCQRDVVAQILREKTHTRTAAQRCARIRCFCR